MGMLTLISQYKVRNITDLLLFPRQRDSSRKKMLPKSASRGAAGYELSSNSAAVMGKEVVEVHARADLQEGSIHVVTAGTGVGAACVCSGQQLWQKAWRDRCRPILVPGKEEAQDVGWRAQFGGVKQAMKECFALSGDSTFPWTLVGDGPLMCMYCSHGPRAL